MTGSIAAYHAESMIYEFIKAVLTNCGTSQCAEREQVHVRSSPVNGTAANFT